MGGYNTRGFVEVLAASQSTVNKDWFQGTADAVRQYMWLFDESIREGVEDFLILSGKLGSVGGGPVWEAEPGRVSPMGRRSGRGGSGRAGLSEPCVHGGSLSTISLTCRAGCTCAGDHLYRMDYRDFVRKHRESGAAITIAALPCDEKVASAFGLMKIDNQGVVIDFAEKPKGEALRNMMVDTTILGVSPEM